MSCGYTFTDPRTPPSYAWLSRGLSTLTRALYCTAADAHTDSGGLHITAHLLHTVQDTSGQWCVESVLERETLSNNTDYQKRLREAKINGVFQGRELKDRLRLIELDYEHRQLQQQVSVTIGQI